MIEQTLYSLLWSPVLLWIPVMVFAGCRVRILKQAVVAWLRCLLQLALAGIYLFLVYDCDDACLTLSWAGVMLVASVDLGLVRSKLPWRQYALPIAICLLLGVALPMVVLTLSVWRMLPFESPATTVPVVALLLGQCATGASAALKKLRDETNRHQDGIRYAIALGATAKEAMREPMVTALVSSAMPQLVDASAAGVLFMPILTAGMLIGGISPIVAVALQWMFFCALFAARTLVNFLVLTWAVRRRERGLMA